jgi:hypothetical protein
MEHRMKPASLLVSIFLVLVAVLHLVRLVFQVEVIVAGAVMPMWASLFGFFIPTGLAMALLRESRINN